MIAKRNLARGVISLLAGLTASAGLAYGAGQITIGGEALRIVDARVQGEQILLTSADGRLFTLPASTPGMAALLDGLESGRGFEARPLSVRDIIELLESGISEHTLRVYLETHRSRYELTKEDLLRLREAGASNAFLEFLIQSGRTASAYRSKQWKAYTYLEGMERDRERPGLESAAGLAQAAEPEFEGIPFFPFSFGVGGPVFGPAGPIFGLPVPPPTEPPAVEPPERRSLFVSSTAEDRPEPLKPGDPRALVRGTRWKPAGANRNVSSAGEPAASEDSVPSTSPVVSGSPARRQTPGTLGLGGTPSSSSGSSSSSSKGVIGTASSSRDSRRSIW